MEVVPDWLERRPRLWPVVDSAIAGAAIFHDRHVTSGEAYALTRSSPSVEDCTIPSGRVLPGPGGRGPVVVIHLHRLGRTRVSDLLQRPAFVRLPGEGPVPGVGS